MAKNDCMENSPEEDHGKVDRQSKKRYVKENWRHANSITNAIIKGKK